MPPTWKKEKKTVHFGRIQAMSLPGRFKLDDSASNELVGVKFYDFFLDPKNNRKSMKIHENRRKVTPQWPHSDPKVIPKWSQNRRKCTKIDENLRKSTKIHENQRKSTNIYENQWKSTKIKEDRRESKIIFENIVHISNNSKDIKQHSLFKDWFNK